MVTGQGAKGLVWEGLFAIFRDTGACLEAVSKKAQPGFLQGALQRLGFDLRYLLCHSNK